MPIVIVKRRGAQVILEGIGTFARDALSFTELPDGRIKIVDEWDKGPIVNGLRPELLVNENGDSFMGTRPLQQAVDEDLPSVAAALPQGGTSGQVLVKNSDADADASWASLNDFTLIFENHLF